MNKLEEMKAIRTGKVVMFILSLIGLPTVFISIFTDLWVLVLVWIIIYFLHFPIMIIVVSYRNFVFLTDNKNNLSFYLHNDLPKMSIEKLVKVGRIKREQEEGMITDTLKVTSAWPFYMTLPHRKKVIVNYIFEADFHKYRYSLKKEHINILICKVKQPLNSILDKINNLEIDGVVSIGDVFEFVLVPKTRTLTRIKLNFTYQVLNKLYKKGNDIPLVGEVLFIEELFGMTCSNKWRKL